MASNFILKELETGYSVIYNKLSQETLLSQNSLSHLSNSKLEDLFDFKINPNRFDARKYFTTVVINTTESCNLRCKYCSRYKENYDGKKTISQDLLNLILERASKYANLIDERVVVQFHGGEPLLKFDLIKNAIIKNKKHNHLLDYRIQTNATLLSDDILFFCKEYDIHLGISIDGPPNLNAITRRFSDGSPIDLIVKRNLEKIKNIIPKHNISCLCVLSSANVHHAENVLNYVYENSIDDVSILPLYPDFSNCITDDNHLIPRTNEMIDFSKKIFDIWLSELEKGREISIPSFQIWFWNLMGKNANFIINNTSCGVAQSMIFIDNNGDIYPCGPFSYEGKFTMGNIMDIDIQDLKKSKIFHEFENRSTQNVEECKECVFQGICLGGCPANSNLKTKDIFQKDPFCEYWFGLISHIVKKIIDKPEICELVPEYSIRL